MAPDTTIFLSDIHIGTNGPTNWYQQSLHEPYLKAALKYVQDNAARVEDLVVLGDWFDLWTYLPSDAPPQVSDIFAANPGVFTRQSDSSGDFVTCLDAVEGGLYFVNGNHDMQATLAEVDAHFAPLSERGRQVLGGDAGGAYAAGKLYAVHGHQYSLFCRADPAEDPAYAGLPLGYFVTRATSLIGVRQIAAWNQAHPEAPIRNVSQLANQGHPLFNFTDLLIDLDYIIRIAEGEDGLAKGVLYDLLREGGVPESQLDDFPFTMPGGATLTAGAAAATFSNLWQGARSVPAVVVDLSDSLTTEGEGLLLGDAYDLVVMGHTHLPLMHQLPLLESIYANSGFNCPPQPDMADRTKAPTFVEVVTGDSGSYTVTINAVTSDGSSFQIEPVVTHTT